VKYRVHPVSPAFGFVKLSDDDRLKVLNYTASHLYVNIRTTNKIDGEIRGNLVFTSSKGGGEFMTALISDDKHQFNVGLAFLKYNYTINNATLYVMHSYPQSVDVSLLCGKEKFGTYHNPNGISQFKTYIGPTPSFRSHLLAGNVQVKLHSRKVEKFTGRFIKRDSESFTVAGTSFVGLKGFFTQTDSDLPLPVYSKTLTQGQIAVLASGLVLIVLCLMFSTFMFFRNRRKEREAKEKKANKYDEKK